MTDEVIISKHVKSQMHILAGAYGVTLQELIDQAANELIQRAIQDPKIQEKLLIDLATILEGVDELTDDPEKELRLVRDRTWGVKCPECDARVGEPCVTLDYLAIVTANHRARENEYRRAIKPMMARDYVHDSGHSVWDVDCPACGAKVGNVCRKINDGTDGPTDNHRERVEAHRESMRDVEGLTDDRIINSLTVDCPICSARSGNPCVDLYNKQSMDPRTTGVHGLRYTAYSSTDVNLPWVTNLDRLPPKSVTSLTVFPMNVKCPTCGAGPSHPCTDFVNYRKQHVRCAEPHDSRVEAATENARLFRSQQLARKCHECGVEPGQDCRERASDSHEYDIVKPHPSR